jgi:hypothetical protein
MSGKAIGFGSLNDPQFSGVYVPQPDKTPEGYLKEIAENTRALKEEYVTQLEFSRNKGQLANGEAKCVYHKQAGVPIHRVFVQLFGTGVLQVFFTNSDVGANDIPDFEIDDNPFPYRFDIPGKELDVTLRLRSGNNLSYSCIVSSSAG